MCDVQAKLSKVKQTATVVVGSKLMQQGMDDLNSKLSFAAVAHTHLVVQGS